MTLGADSWEVMSEAWRVLPDRRVFVYLGTLGHIGESVPTMRGCLRLHGICLALEGSQTKVSHVGGQ